MHDVECFLKWDFLILHRPFVNLPKGFLSYGMIAIFDYLWRDEELSTSIDIPKAFTASIDDQTKQNALRKYISRWQGHKILNLPLKEWLERIVVPTNDSK